jgi:hypothetical protein
MEGVMDKNVREILEAPFPNEEIRTRKGTFGKELAYAEVHSYIARLNHAFAGDWSFDITEHTIKDNEVMVLGKLTAGDIHKSAFGCSTITTTRDSGERVSVGHDLKAAASDALKKCCSLLGLGLHLYGAQAGDQAPAVTVARSPESKETPPTASRSTPEGGQAPLRISERQLSAILALAKSKGDGEVAVRTKILDGFGVPIEKLDRRQASEVISALNNGGLGQRAGVGGAR